MSYDFKKIRSWKKVFESDLDNIIIELKEVVSSPCVIILGGPVGAGKTTFTKYFLGEEQGQSPTYSLINDCGDVVHADFYRLENKDEIMHLEIPLYLESKNYFLVEWGKDFIDEINEEVGDGFGYFFLDISINDKVDEKTPASRNFFLSKVLLN